MAKRTCKYGKTKAGKCRKKAKKRGGKSCKFGVVKAGKRKGQCLKNKRQRKAA